MQIYVSHVVIDLNDSSAHLQNLLALSDTALYCADYDAPTGLVGSLSWVLPLSCVRLLDIDTSQHGVLQIMVDNASLRESRQQKKLVASSGSIKICVLYGCSFLDFVSDICRCYFEETGNHLSVTGAEHTDSQQSDMVEVEPPESNGVDSDCGTVSTTRATISNSATESPLSIGRCSRSEGVVNRLFGRIHLG